uniref:Cilia and flagella associated protein 20 n=1 Tax=Oncorhynchus kisutch TaxID=8019 RepID=A0A8C7G8P4_ONCKI
MFKNTFQSGFLSILYSIGSKPLQIWDKKVRNGHIKRITDNDIQSLVLEVEGTNVSTTYITCPADPKKTLGIKLPFLVMIIKNLKKYFTFEVQVLDDKNVRRRFRASNYQSTTRVKPFICTMPMRLDDGWNQIQFNLSDFTRRAYGTNYIETLRVQIHANCRIRRVYFSDRLYSEDELPAEFKLYLPVQNKAKVSTNNVNFKIHLTFCHNVGLQPMFPQINSGTELILGLLSTNLSENSVSPLARVYCEH